jgi:hypothetical protein
VDLDRDAVEVVHVFDEKDFRPHGVRMSKLLLDPESYVISAAKLKTHDRIVATLSLKNIVFGAPIKDAGFRWGKNRTPGAQNDKPIAHGSGFRAINYNLFDLARAPRMHREHRLAGGRSARRGTDGHRFCQGRLPQLLLERRAGRGGPR